MLLPLRQIYNEGFHPRQDLSGKEFLIGAMEPKEQELDELRSLVDELEQQYDVPEWMREDAKQQVALLWIVHWASDYRDQLVRLDFAEWIAAQCIAIEREIEHDEGLVNYEHGVLDSVYGRRKSHSR